MTGKKVLFTTDLVDDSMYMSSDLHVLESIKGSGALEFEHERQYSGGDRFILYREGVILLNKFLSEWLNETQE